MQALSHFTYHQTNRAFLLCDLQGGIYGDGVVLTDPVILSQNRAFGVTDLGPQGISTFFSYHTCSEFCRPHWLQPNAPRAFFRPTSSTSMMCVPTQQGRRSMTRQRYSRQSRQSRQSRLEEGDEEDG